MPTLAQIWPRIPGQWRPADTRPERPAWGATWFGPDGNTVWYWAGDTTYQFRTDHITKDLYDMPEPQDRVTPYESTFPPTDPRVHADPCNFRDADARYRSTLHTEPSRTIRIDAEGLDAGIYVELLRMITDRWPRAKLAGGGIVVPEDTAPSTMSAPPVPSRRDHADLMFWGRNFNEDIVTALAVATGQDRVEVAEALAHHGQRSPDSHSTIAAFITESGVTSA